MRCICGARFAVGWLLPLAFFLVFSAISSGAIELTEEEFETLSENLTELETLNAEQARELQEREITLKQLQAQVIILQTASNSLTNHLNVTANALSEANASLTRAAQYWSEQEGVHRRRTLLTALISGLVTGFAGLVTGVVWG